MCFESLSCHIKFLDSVSNDVSHYHLRSSQDCHVCITDVHIKYHENCKLRVIKRDGHMDVMVHKLVFPYKVRYK
jgi:hypothetical protein